MLGLRGWTGVFCELRPREPDHLKRDGPGLSGLLTVESPTTILNR
jgi:hypothetical protein